MPPRVTIVTPSFDHGETLRYAIETARRQGFEDFEHLIVGDGICESGRRIAQQYERDDARARFLNYPKGEHYGELNKDKAIRDEARGELILYLGDDDLWFDDHVQKLVDLLENADFAYAATVFVETDDTLGMLYSDVNAPTYREEMLGGYNRIAGSAVGHRRDAYLRLERGWCVAGPGEYSDLKCWQQFLRDESMRFAFTGVVTSIKFQSVGSERGSWGERQRVEELERWAPKLRDPAQAAALRERFADLIFRLAADRQAESIYWQKIAADNEWLAADRQREIDRRYSSVRDALRRRVWEQAIRRRPDAAATSGPGGPPARPS